MGTQPGEHDPIDHAIENMEPHHKRFAHQLSEGVFSPDGPSKETRKKQDPKDKQAAKSREEAKARAFAEGLKHGQATGVLLEKLVNHVHDPNAYRLRNDPKNKLADVGAIDLFVETVVASMADRNGNGMPTKHSLEACALFFKVVFSPEMLKAAQSIQNAANSNLLMTNIEAAAAAMARRKLAENFPKP